MVFKKSESDYFNVKVISFLIVAVILTLFSLFYSSWYNSKVTGHSVSECVSDCSGASDNFEGVSGESSGSTTSSTVPPQQVVSQVSQVASSVSQSAQYASTIGSLVGSRPLSETQLKEYQSILKEIIVNSNREYKEVSKDISKYSSRALSEYQSNIVKDLSEIEKEINKINSILSQTVSTRQENQKKEAMWILDRQSKISDSQIIADSYISDLAITGKNPIDSCDGKDCVVSSDSSCSPLVYVAALDLDVVDFGKTGYDSIKSEKCKIEDFDVYVRPVVLNLNKPLIGDNGLPIINIVTIHFSNIQNSETNLVGGAGQFSAVVIVRDGSYPIFNFFSSPSYSDLESQIDVFINQLIYGQSEDFVDSFPGLSSLQLSELIQNSKGVPWVLWGVLSSMLIFFLFFEKIYLFGPNSLIYEGKKALSRKDYFNAIKNYNILLDHYSDDVEFRQDILNYLILIKNKIGDRNILFDFTQNKKLPKISYKSDFSFYGDKFSVEKMIHIALNDLNKNPKSSKSMMPIISQSYKLLSTKDRKEIAPLYEKLVYSLKNY